jgi:hypothetical protein
MHPLRISDPLNGGSFLRMEKVGSAMRIICAVAHRAPAGDAFRLAVSGVDEPPNKIESHDGRADLDTDIHASP